MLYNFPVIPHVKKQKHHSNVKECMRKSSLSAINICLLFTTRIQPGAFVWPHKSGSEWLQMSRMNMAISHIALQHVSQWKTSPFCFDSACLVVFSGTVDNSAGRAFEEELKGMFEIFWSAGCAIQWYRSCIFIAKSFVSPSAFLFCRKPSFQDFGTLCHPPSGQLSRTTHSGDFRPQIMKGIWKKCKCKEHNLLIMLNDFTFNMHHLNSNICNANVCMTWTPKESMCRPFDTAIRLANAEPPL